MSGHYRAIFLFLPIRSRGFGPRRQ